MKKPFFFLKLALGGIIIGAIVVLAAIRFDETKNNQKTTSIRPPVKVEVARVKLGPLSQWIMGEGTVRAVRREFLNFENPGKVVFIGNQADGTSLREGSRVYGPGEGETLGQLVARVDSREHLHTLKLYEAELAQARQGVRSARAELEQVEGQYELMKKNFGRAEILYKKGAYSVADYEEMKTNLSGARAGLKAAKADLKRAEAVVSSVTIRINQTKLIIEKTSIFAPFDGVIIRMNIRVGDYASLAPLNTIVEQELFDSAAVVVMDPNEFEITLELPSFYGTLVKENQRSLIRSGEEITLSGEPRESVVKGSVYSVTPAITPDKRTIRVKIRANDSKRQLIDGSFVMGSIAVEEKEETLIVPTAALLFQNSKAYVFVVDLETRTAQRRDVQVGISDGSKTEITSGIEADQLVIVNGKYRIVNGAPVKLLTHDKEL